jgi:hypothetical protein
MRGAFLLFGLALALVAPFAGVQCAAAALGDCGQPATSGNAPTASDALFVLRAATGSQTCEPCVCDVDDSGGVSASDALRVLRRAVGQTIELLCPACSPPPCDAVQAPACGGTCTGDLTCAPDPLVEGECACLSSCEASQAPACGGSCDFALPAELDCSPITFGGSRDPVETCMCLPPGLAVCVDAQAPSCGGICQAGSACLDTGGSCACAEQPAQGACEGAAAPACAGTCGDGLICLDDGGQCACADAEGLPETCGGAEAPACEGTCASGRVCAVESLGDCGCVEPCEVSDAPACGGACTAPGEQCAYATVNLGGATLDACECRPTSAP